MAQRKHIVVVTGTRAEFGLLVPVMRAIDAHPALKLSVVVTGAHLMPPGRTIDHVANLFPIAARVGMQRAGESGRLKDAAALGRGVIGLAAAYGRLAPDCVVVLGDRIEVLAAASAASVGGFPVAHIHGGDRAEGVADEAMRHAVTKLAHIHFPATPQSGDRVLRMGERPETVHVVGSPAIDGLAAMPPLDDESYAELGWPEIVVLMHPAGLGDGRDGRMMRALIDAVEATGRQTLALAPNHDAGREEIIAELEAWRARTPRSRVRFSEGLPRERFVGLLRRVGAAPAGGALVGNSSSGLIESAALGVRVIDIGPRQAGRERGGSVVHLEESEVGRLPAVLAEVLGGDGGTEGVVGGVGGVGRHPYGDGRAGERIAEVLATTDLRDQRLLRKRNVY